MRRSDEEFKDEILKRSQRYIERRKHIQKNVMCAGASIAVLLIAMVSLKSGLFIRNTAKQAVHDENLVNDVVTKGTSAETAEHVVQETTREWIADCTVTPETAVVGTVEEADSMDNIVDATANCGIDLEYTADYLRIDGSGETIQSGYESVDSGNNSLPLIKIDSFDELNSFISRLKQNDSVWDSVDSIPVKYNEAYFNDNTLLLIYAGEGSGSVRHKVTLVTRLGNELSIGIERIFPEIGTCDMAGWFIMVGLRKTDVAGCDVFVAH